MSWSWLDTIVEARAQGSAVALVTLTGTDGSAPRDAGTRMVVWPDGSFQGTIGGGKLEALLIEDARKALSERAAVTTKRYPLAASAGQCCGGSVDAMIELIGQQAELYLFGAGHVAQALVRVLAESPFKIHVIDERSEWTDQLSPGTSKHDLPWQSFVNNAQWSESHTYVAIMTHQHDLDQDILEAVLAKPTRYVGLIGSNAKWKRFQQRLTAKGVAADALAHVHCPIGIDIGGKSPTEVAISTSAQLIRTLHQGN